MEIEYQTQVPESAKKLLDDIIERVFEYFEESTQRTAVLEELFELRIELRKPITGTVEVEPEDMERAEREPYPDWYDMD